MINKKLLIITLIISIITATAAYLYLENIKAELDTTEYIEVVVAAVNIPQDTVLSKDLLLMKKIPVEYVHPDAALQIDMVANKINKVPLTKGEGILGTHIMDQFSTEEGLAYALSPGMRALTLDINQVSALNYLILPGDKVDILVTINTNETTQTSYVLENIKVLALGTQMVRNIQDQGREQQTITLQVNPTNAPKLVLASEAGNIRMLLRSPREEGRVGEGRITLQELLGR
ncbi:MAG: Flp pilus assembly protein CpaB [Clostridia bacterium]|nr:Flp pilus assembly protein CpaB [Clostridia bacterium]